MPPFDTISFQKNNMIAYVTLNRPRVLNAYNMQMRDELCQVLEAIRLDEDIGAVILTGAGDRAFCAGADLTEFGTTPSQVIARNVRWERDIWGLLIDLPQITIAALHGYVLGSGVELALLCDIRIAAKDTILGLPETALGMLPAGGGTQSLARIGGISTALNLLLSGNKISAQEALSLGLVERVVAGNQLLTQAKVAAEALVSPTTRCFVSVKKAVTLGMDLKLADGLALETRLALPLLTARQLEQGRN
jgi:enoyl-CoA hydratase